MNGELITEDSLVKGLHDAKYGYNDIHGTVTLVPELLKLPHRVLDVTFGACADNTLDDDRMGLIANFEDIVTRDEVEP